MHRVLITEREGIADMIERIGREYDYSNIIGRKVSGTIDRPMGSYHPRNEDIYYTVNYGYVNGIMGGDGAEQDVYLLGVTEPVKTFEGIVTAVIHRLDDCEDKWIVIPEGAENVSNEEIIKETQFVEQFFTSELYR